MHLFPVSAGGSGTVHIYRYPGLANGVADLAIAVRRYSKEHSSNSAKKNQQECERTKNQETLKAEWRLRYDVISGYKKNPGVHRGSLLSGCFIS